MKVGIVGAIIGVVYIAVTTFKKFSNEFSLSIVGYGRPDLNGTELTVPLKVRYHNPTPVPLHVDRLIADISLVKVGNWVKAGRIDQSVTIAGGDSEQTINAKIDLSFFGGNIYETLNAVLQALQNRSLKVRTDVTAEAAGITIPTETFVDTVAL